MPEDSVQNESGFYLKPGGVREEGLATDLPMDSFSQSHGCEQQGIFQRVPGKQIVTQFADRVLAIAGFGGALLIQHGPNLIMYPDACAVAPTPENYVAPAPGGTFFARVNFIVANRFMANNSYSGQSPAQSPRQAANFLGLALVIPGNQNFVQYWDAAFLSTPSNYPNYNQVTFGDVTIGSGYFDFDVTSLVTGTSNPPWAIGMVSVFEGETGFSSDLATTHQYVQASIEDDQGDAACTLTLGDINGYDMYFMNNLNNGAGHCTAVFSSYTE